jgi:hypothetical protein
VHAAAKPIRIGVLTGLSGPYRDTSGPTSFAAVRQAAADFAAAGAGSMSKRSRPIIKIKPISEPPQRAAGSIPMG